MVQSTQVVRASSVTFSLIEGIGVFTWVHIIAFKPCFWGNCLRAGRQSVLFD